MSINFPPITYKYILPFLPPSYNIKRTYVNNLTDFNFAQKGAPFFCLGPLKNLDIFTLDVFACEEIHKRAVVKCKVHSVAKFIVFFGNIHEQMIR